MTQKILKWAVMLWVGLWTLLILRSVFGGLTNPRATFGIGILHMTGRTTLVATIPLAVAGMFGLWLLAKERPAGAILIAAFSLTWSLCLGLDQFHDFMPAMSVIAVVFLLTAVWCISRLRPKKRLAAGQS